MKSGVELPYAADVTPGIAAKQIRWHAPRDIRPTPDGDHADIAKLSGSPTITRNAADHSKATMLADGVGTFHIAPFIDCNGTDKFEPTIDLPLANGPATMQQLYRERGWAQRAGA